MRIAVMCAALVAILAFAAAADAAAPRYGHRTLKLGARGADVKQLQAYLSELGIATPSDGYYGKATAARVKTFERRQGQRADGRVTPAEARLIALLVYNGADSAASANTGGTSPDRGSGDSGTAASNPTAKARLSSDGRTAIAPDNAPPQVKQAIAAANRITRMPYRWGGGHGHWDDSGYDCSGSVGYALHGAALLSQPMDSTGLESWGEPGRGEWITVYANGGHTYAVIAGLRFDTAPSGRGESGPRWRTQSRSSSGFVARHWAKL